MTSGTIVWHQVSFIVSTSNSKSIVNNSSCLTNMYMHDVVPIAFLSPFALANQTTVPDVRTDEGKSQEEE